MDPVQLSPSLMSDFWWTAGPGSFQQLPPLALVPLLGFCSSSSFWSSFYLGWSPYRVPASSKSTSSSHPVPCRALVSPGTSGTSRDLWDYCPFFCLLLSTFCFHSPVLPVDFTTGVTLFHLSSHLKSAPPLPNCVFGLSNRREDAPHSNLRRFQPRTLLPCCWASCYLLNWCEWLMIRLVALVLLNTNSQSAPSWP